MMNVLTFKKYLHDETIEELKTINSINLYVVNTIDDLPQETLDTIDVLVGGPTKEIVAKLPSLKLAQLFSAGANTFTWLDDSIILANAYGAYGKAIGEHMLASTLMFQKNFPAYYENQREREWKRRDPVFVMKDATILSVGAGAIGSEYLRLCKLLGAKTIGVRRSIHDKPDYVDKLCTMDKLDTLLPEADVVALSLPETEETIHLFNKDKFHLMKKSAILINVGRGSALVENDLITVLKEGYFQGVSLDVTEIEPLPKNNPLWNFPNVQITPHISGGYFSTANYDNVIAVVKENLTRYANNKPVLHEVNKKLGY